MSIRRTILVLAVSGVAALGVAACGDDDSDDSGTSTAAGADATSSGSEATVEFVSPEDGATESGTVTAEVELSNFDINADAVGKAPMEGEGHLHFAMDGGKYDMPKYSGANGELAKQLGVDGTYSPATEPTITYKNLPPGEHTLMVHLADNNHSDTGVEAETTFTVE